MALCFQTVADAGRPSPTRSRPPIKSTHHQHDLDELDSIQRSVVPTLSDTDVRVYAQFLNIDLTRYPQALWIVEEALHAPCEPPWAESVDQRGSSLYTNAETGAASTRHPLEERYRSLYTRLCDEAAGAANAMDAATETAEAGGATEAAKAAKATQEGQAGEAAEVEETEEKAATAAVVLAPQEVAAGAGTGAAAAAARAATAVAEAAPWSKLGARAARAGITVGRLV